MEIAIYTFCVMYSPGPVNILALNQTLTGQGWSILGYCCGVGLAMFIGFAVLGFTGQALWIADVAPFFALLGSAYILYIAYRLWHAAPKLDMSEGAATGLWLRDGLLLQLLNPKGLTVILPVTTVMFPAARITGFEIIGCAALISLGAVGAPAAYAAGGAVLGDRLIQPRLFELFNRLMSLMLALVALSIVYELFENGIHVGAAT